MYIRITRQLCQALALGACLIPGPGWAQVPLSSALDQTDGDQALRWVHAQNGLTQRELTSDPAYPGLYRKVLAAQQSPQRLALPMQKGEEIWNFWQDENHKRGIWRSTDAVAFNHGRPNWKTRFDLDAYSLSTYANWVMEGLNCLEPEERYCMMALSNAGEDANVLREYDTQTDSFVSAGFDLPSGKQTAVWLDQDHLLVSRDWGVSDAGLTRSGYPYSVRILHRGQSLSKATEVYRGVPSDMDVLPASLRDETGRQIFLIERHRDFFHTEVSVFDPNKHRVSRLPLPEKYDGLVSLSGQLVFHLLQDWSVQGKTFPADSIISVDPADLNAGRSGVPQIVLTPTSRQTIGDGLGQAMTVTKDGLLVVVYENVQPSLRILRQDRNHRWVSRSVALPADMSAEIVSADPQRSQAYVQLEGFIQPPQLWQVDAQSGLVGVLYRQPDLFDASNLVVEQFFAKSSDSTQIPYFIVHARNWRLDGRRPTLVTAYGGFGLSYLPVYHPDIGITWLDRGGVYVMANIRGGGEFGPAWHEIARREGRQHAYDDLASVARDLGARGVSSSRHLGFRGRSNGGLLAGVMLTQHPELWNAVIIGVPLLDMMNYETMAAGASWAAEYGSVAEDGPHRFWSSVSPLQALRAGVNYPESFIFTSTRDDRVGPIHARRFAARLERLRQPFLYYEDTEGGHAGTVNAAEVAHERSLEAIYLQRRLMGVN